VGCPHLHFDVSAVCHLAHIKAHSEASYTSCEHLMPEHRAELALAKGPRGKNQILMSLYDRIRDPADEITRSTPSPSMKTITRLQGSGRVGTECARPPILAPAIDHPCTTLCPSNALCAVAAAAISHDDVPTVRIGDFADDGADRRGLVEGRDNEAKRPLRIPQFWQGAGGCRREGSRGSQDKQGRSRSPSDAAASRRQTRSCYSRTSRMGRCSGRFRRKLKPTAGAIPLNDSKRGDCQAPQALQPLGKRPDPGPEFGRWNARPIANVPAAAEIRPAAFDDQGVASLAATWPMALRSSSRITKLIRLPLGRLKVIVAIWAARLRLSVSMMSLPLEGRDMKRLVNNNTR